MKKTFTEIINEIKEMQSYTTQFYELMYASYGAQKNAETFFNKLEAFKNNLSTYIHGLETFEEEMHALDELALSK